MPSNSRCCITCGATKPLSEFRKKGIRNGQQRYDSQCKPCRKLHDRQHVDRKRKYNQRYHRQNPDYNRKYYMAHREQINQRSLRYYAAHREEMKEQQRRYYEANKEKKSAYYREYRKANLQKRIDLALRYRARQRAAPGHFTKAQFQALCEHYRNICLRCGESKPLTHDHVVPLIDGGGNDISNIQPLCLSCNCRKGTKSTDYRLGEHKTDRA